MGTLSPPLSAPLRRQFSRGFKPVQPWVHSAGCSARFAAWRATVGLPCQRMPPTSSTRFLAPAMPHTLLTIGRLARALGEHWGKPSLRAELAAYERRLLRARIEFVDQLVSGSYRSFERFEVMVALFVMYYFAGAIQSETRRRQGLAGDADAFLFSHYPPFRDAVARRHHAGAAGGGAGGGGVCPSGEGADHRGVQLGGAVMPIRSAEHVSVRPDVPGHSALSPCPPRSSVGISVSNA